MANSVDPVASDLGLHCLQRPICLNLRLLRYICLWWEAVMLSQILGKTALVELSLTLLLYIIFIYRGPPL